LEAFWDAILSREPKRIQSAYLPLDMATRNSLVEHLQKMASEPGWHPEQVKSAQAALQAIQDISKE
jgi:hypothetical protein